MRIQKVLKHGNALAVVIPVQQLRELDLKRGDNVQLQVLHRGPKEEQAPALRLIIWKVKP